MKIPAGTRICTDQELRRRNGETTEKWEERCRRMNLGTWREPYIPEEKRNRRFQEHLDAFGPRRSCSVSGCTYRAWFGEADPKCAVHNQQ